MTDDFLRRNSARRAGFLLSAVALLAFATACGSGNGGSGGGGGGGGNNGGFSQSSLKGQYTFTLRGIGTPDLINSFFFVEGGVFTADGNGNITAGTDDIVFNFTAFSDSVTGAYAINTDGTGNIQFNFPGGGSSVYRITFSDASHFYMEEADGFGTSGGSGEKQDTSAFAATPSGTFVYQTHDLALGSATVGVINVASGAITGTGDALSSGVLITPLTVTGSVQAPGSTTGRGTMTISDDTGTSSYLYYVVSAGKIRFLNTSAVSSLAIGQAEAQTGGPFNAASFNGNYVFGSSGETTNVSGIHSVGLFTADGAGHISAGTFDTVQDGNPVTNIGLNAGSSYIASANGRMDVLLNLSTGLVNEKILYMVSPSRAYFLVNDAVNVEDGTLDKQSTAAFSNSSMKGQYSFLMDGFDNNAQLPYRDRVGTWTPDGSGTVKTSYIASGYVPTLPPAGAATANNLSGTYSVPANGRATASVNNLSSNLLLYMVSGSSGYMLQADPGVDIGGAFTIQPAQ